MITAYIRIRDCNACRENGEELSGLGSISSHMTILAGNFNVILFSLLHQALVGQGCLNESSLDDSNDAAMQQLLIVPKTLSLFWKMCDPPFNKICRFM